VTSIVALEILRAGWVATQTLTCRLLPSLATAKRHLAPWILASAFASRSTIAFAGNDSPTPPASSAEVAARKLFKEGNELFNRGFYEAALDKFQNAYEAWNNPKIKLNIATAARAIGREADALGAYRQYLRDGEPSPERRAEVEGLCNELLEHLAIVRLGVAPGVQRLWLDGVELTVHDLGPVYLDAGEHLIVLEGGGSERTIEFEVQAGEMRELALDVATPEPARTTPAHASAPGERAMPDVSAEPRTPGASLGLLARADIDGRGRGVVGALALGYALDPHWQIAAGGLIGKTRGVWAGLELLLGDGVLQPTVGVSAPVFFAAGAHPGLSGEAGMRWTLGNSGLFLRARVAVVHFPSVPDGYSKTVFVPSLGSELQL
jgi:hypothetical protein